MEQHNIVKVEALQESFVGSIDSPIIRKWGSDKSALASFLHAHTVYIGTTPRVHHCLHVIK